MGKAVKPGKGLLEGGYMSQSTAPLASDKIHFACQIVAVAVAKTLEVAQAAAGAVVIDYEVTTASPTLGSEAPKRSKLKHWERPSFRLVT